VDYASPVPSRSIPHCYQRIKGTLGPTLDQLGKPVLQAAARACGSPPSGSATCVIAARPCSPKAASPSETSRSREAGGLKLALLYERRHECLGEDSRRAGADAQQVAAWLEKAMVDGMDEVINPRLDANHPNWPFHSAVCAVCFYSREEVTLG
jgi:hypothetical protein